jgi:benzoyl-CoA reductase/2-hydroxyglutaryl-CoA dehydratase subunit BcrC/BadD/HgdB
MEEKRLAVHLIERPAQLREAQRKGVKVVGYFPGNYVPEELIYASGAIPVCLTRGGNAAASEAGLTVVPRVICPFARAQIGERIARTDPYYAMLDMLVAPITCQHLKKVAEVWEFQGGLEMFKLGIPQQCQDDFELEYFINRLKALKDRLQTFTGNEITDEKLSQAIRLYNRIKDGLKKISLLRRASPTPINALDFIHLNQASLYADPVVMVDILNSIYQELKKKQSAARTDAPRLLLVGPSLGYGDDTVLELVREAGGEVVIEELYEGMRYYWNTIPDEGDRLAALARGYLIDRLPPAFMRYSARRRLDFNLDLIQKYQVAGVIWYQLLCCETYDAESYYFARKLEEQNIPMLILESDYSTADTGQMKTRIEALIEVVKGVM